MIPGGEGQGPLLALLLLAGAGGLLALSGVPGLFLPRRSPWSSRLATALTVVACLVGLSGAFPLLATTENARLAFPSPFAGLRSALGVDALSAWFAVPILLVGALGSIYGEAYWPARRHPRTSRRLRFCYGLLLASLVFVLLARDGSTFLVAWEVMALTNFFLVTTEEHDPAVRRAGWLYLLYSHVTILGLLRLLRPAALADRGARLRTAPGRGARVGAQRALRPRARGRLRPEGRG